MQFAISHDAVSADYPAEAYEPSPAKQRRVATTTTLLALALCAFMAKGHLLAAQAPSRAAATAQNNVTAPVTIVAPEFCKDQTWPYIDSRCLRRIDNPDAPQATVALAKSAAATPVPSRESSNTVAATPPTAETNTAQTNVAPTTTATNAAPAAAAPTPTDTRNQVVQSVFPAAAPDTRAYPATNAYTRAVNASQHRRSEHWNNQSGFFGFRF